MADLLRGCRAKIERANECVKNLDAEIVSFLTSRPAPYVVTKEFQDDSREYVFMAKAIRTPPDRFAVIAGEVVHHLASSLDHLFAALVQKAGNTVEKRHYFPIYTKPREFKRACEKGAIKDVSVPAQKIIRSVQPCYTPTPLDTILAVVRELNNIDKHQLLIVVSTVAEVGDYIELGSDGGIVPEVIRLGMPNPVEITKDDVEFFRISLAKPAPQFKADTNIAAQVVLKQCGLAKLIPVTKVLTMMIAGVAHTIGQFRGEFDSDD